MLGSKGPCSGPQLPTAALARVSFLASLKQQLSKPWYSASLMGDNAFTEDASLHHINFDSLCCPKYYLQNGAGTQVESASPSSAGEPATRPSAQPAQPSTQPAHSHAQ